MLYKFREVKALEATDNRLITGGRKKGDKLNAIKHLFCVKRGKFGMFTNFFKENIKSS